MKVLLVTHGEDIDGVGSIVLLDYSSLEYDCVTSIANGIDEVVLKNVINSNTKEYDIIFITDLCPSLKILEKIENREDLKSKTIVLDHHQTSIDSKCDKYDFVKIVLEDDKGRQSGTGLFYDYLISNGFLVGNETLERFVQLTRRYDTWDWKRIYNDLEARKLHVIFEQMGRDIDEYVASVEDVINYRNGFKFTKEQEELVLEYDNNLLSELKSVLSGMKVCSLTIEKQEYIIGLFEGEYKYRNDFVEVVRDDNENDIDLLAMIATDKDSVSLRSVKDVDVAKVAEHFGGKGHRESASFMQENGSFKEFIKRI